MNLKENIERILEVMDIKSNEIELKPKIWKQDDICCSFPENPNVDEVLIFWGGIGVLDFTFRQLVSRSNLSSRRIIWGTDYSQDIKHLLEGVRSCPLFDKKKKYQIKSVFAYSGGGPQALKEIGKGYFIGLADVHIDANGFQMIQNNVPGNQSLDKIKLIYNLGFWCGKESSKDYAVGHPENPCENMKKTIEILGESAKGNQSGYAGHASACSSFLSKWEDLL